MAASKSAFNYDDARVGIDKMTGAVLKGWPHCRQSIMDIIGTRKFTRVMCLDYGSDVPNRIDRPSNAAQIVALYVDIATALRPRYVGGRRLGEPGFKVTKFQVASVSKDGSSVFDIAGIYYPFGHLGDYSVSEPQSLSASVRLR